MKQASVLLATARAQRVFPVPGGPKRSTPLGGSIPRLTKRSGCGGKGEKLFQKIYKQKLKVWQLSAFTPTLDPARALQENVQEISA